MKFTMRHTFNTDVDTYWNKIFFDDEFNRRLFVDELKFKSYEVLELTGKPGEARTRRMRTEPKSDAPVVIQKMIGGSIQYTDEGRFDPDTKKWKFSIITSKLSDTIKISGLFWCEPRGEKKIERICEMEATVKIFGIGGTAEGFIEKTTRESYDVAARFTNRFIAEKGL